MPHELLQRLPLPTVTYRYLPLQAESMPHELLQRLLNLAEFMERDSTTPLGIRWNKLGEIAIRAHAYAKALHYKEIDRYRPLPTVTYRYLPSQVRQGAALQGDRLRRGVAFVGQAGGVDLDQQAAAAAGGGEGRARVRKGM